jgi:hypothetical protein
MNDIRCVRREALCEDDRSDGTTASRNLANGHGICTRIIGYETLVEQGNKAAADHIATSADTCNNICIACMHILFIHCVRSNDSVLMSLSFTECSFIHSVGRFAQVDEEARCHSENIRQHQS